jgi:hypothetical protein
MTKEKRILGQLSGWITKYSFSVDYPQLVHIIKLPSIQYISYSEE